jgi:hypothetical protein
MFHKLLHGMCSILILSHPLNTYSGSLGNGAQNLVKAPKRGNIRCFQDSLFAEDP